MAIRILVTFVVVCWGCVSLGVAPELTRARPLVQPTVLLVVDVDDSIEQGNVQLQQRHFSEAIAHFSEAIQLNPKRAQAYALRAYARQQSGDFATAIVDYSSVVALDPNNAAAYVDRGLVRGMQGDVSGAIADHTHAIQLDPSYARAYNARAIARCVNGDRAGGRDDFQQAGLLSLNTGDRTLYSIAQRSRDRLCR